MKSCNLVFLIIFFFCLLVFSQENKNDIFFVDGHTHDLVPRNGSIPTQSDIEKLLKSGVDGVILAFPLNRTNSENLLIQIIKDLKFVKEYALTKGIIIEYVDKFQYKGFGSEKNKLQVIPSVEFFDGIFNENITRIEQFSKLGIRSITLDNNSFDRLSDNGRDLNSFGKSVIRKMNELRIKIDISHLAEALQLDVIETSTKPVFASHSNCKSISSVERNLSDHVLKRLCEKGGLVLFTFDKDYILTEIHNNGIEALLQHIKHLDNICGINSIGLGSDFGGSGKNAPPDLSNIACFKQIESHLKELRLTEEHVTKIMGRNIIDYFLSE